MNVAHLCQRKHILTLLLIFAILAATVFVPAGSAFAQTAESESFTFSLCPDDSSAEDVGAEQLSMVVTDLGDGEIEIVFSNASGTFDSSITDIYLHDPFGYVIDGDVTLEATEAVNFEQTETMALDTVTCPVVSPDGPPEALGFVAVDQGEVSAASIQTQFHNGVNTNEWLKLKFKASPGVTYQQILIALKTGQLKVGLKLLLQLIALITKYLKCDPHDPGTYIQLASFDAEPIEDGVMVRWETAAEVDNAGFNLYRSESMGGPFTKLNGKLLAANGNGGGATYEFLDPDGTGGSFYRLEDIDYNGTSTLHLPMPTKTAKVTLDNALFVPFVTIH